MLEEICGLEKLGEFLEKNPGNLHERIIQHYVMLGESLGFKAERNVAVFADGKGRGAECCWFAEGKRVAGFEVEFGNKEEMRKAFARLEMLNPEIAVLFVSSSARAGFSISELKEIVGSSQFLKNEGKKFVIADIEAKRCEVLESKTAVEKPKEEVQLGAEVPAARAEGEEKKAENAGGYRGSSASPQHRRRKIIKGRRGEHKEQD
ncbi:MAG: hypothetical protein ABIH99_02475 [Candidatus Micrarchaeota archaeon]